MRKTIITSAAILLLAVVYVTAQKSNVEIPPKTTLELDYSDYKMYELQLKNNTGKDIEVKVQNKETGEFVRGFGLGPLGKVEVMVEQGNKILFKTRLLKLGNLPLPF